MFKAIMVVPNLLLKKLFAKTKIKGSSKGIGKKNGALGLWRKNSVAK